MTEKPELKEIARDTIKAPEPQGFRAGEAKPELTELDKLRLEKLNLSISNINLQLALLNERARTLQREVAELQVKKEILIGRMPENYGLDGKWRLNLETLNFEPLNPETNA